MNYSFPNIFIALRIMDIMPITIASAERSFLKLKLIKNCLQTTMKNFQTEVLLIASYYVNWKRNL